MVIHQIILEDMEIRKTENKNQFLKIQDFWDFICETKSTFILSFVHPIFFAFIFSTTVYSQGGKNELKNFEFTELANVLTRKDVLEKYVCVKQPYIPIQLSSQLKEEVSNSIISSFNEWNSLFIIPKMDSKCIWLNEKAVVGIGHRISDIQNQKIINDEIIHEFNWDLLNEMSLIISGVGDTLVLIPIKVEQKKGNSDKIEYRTYLYCQNLDEINRINFLKSIIKSVVKLEQHASILAKYGLKLDQSDIEQFNINIQNRVIDSINTAFMKLPKIYCVVANNIVSENRFFKPLVSAYLIFESDDHNFISNEKKYSSFPKQDRSSIFNLSMTDSVEIHFHKNELIDKIRRINYYEYFTANFPKMVPDIYGNLRPKEPFELDNAHYMFPIGFPKLDSTSQPYETEESWWGDVIEYKKLEERPEKLEFDSFFQKHVTNDTLSKQRLIDLPETFDMSVIPTWYSLIQLVKYTKEGLVVAVKLGDNNKDRLIYSKDFETIWDDYSVNYNTKNKDFFETYSIQYPREKTGICVFNSDKLYQYYSSYMDIYSRECHKIDSIITINNQNEEARLENEEALQKEMIAKYGQKYIDAMQKLTIIVGMHEDLVNVIVSKIYYVESSRSTGNKKCFRLNPKYGTGWVYLCIENNKVTSVTYY